MKKISKAPAEAGDDAVLEAPCLGLRPERGASVGGDAAQRLDRAELGQRIAGAQRIVEEASAIEDAGLARAQQEGLVQHLVPQPLDLLGLGEEAVAADVEMEALVGLGAGDAADMDRIGFQDDDAASGLRQQVARRQPGWPRPDADDNFVCGVTPVERHRRLRSEAARRSGVSICNIAIAFPVGCHNNFGWSPGPEGRPLGSQIISSGRLRLGGGKAVSSSAKSASLNRR